MSEFTDLQQQIIDDDLRTMPAEMVEEILANMKPAEADEFLEWLGHLRAAEIAKVEE